MSKFPDIKNIIDIPENDTDSPKKWCLGGCLFDLIPLVAILGSGAYIYYLMRESADIPEFIIPAVIIGISTYAIFHNRDGYGPL